MDLFHRLSVNLCIGLCLLAHQRTVLASTLDCRKCAKTPTQPTCEKEFYLQSASVPECPCVCTQCHICGVGIMMFLNYEAQKCDQYTNTVCCPDADMIVIEGECRPAQDVTTGNTTPKSNLTTQSHDKEVTSPEHNGGADLKSYILTLIITLTASFGCAFKG